jgi:F-type H+/Na+-transporting ATPase subunit beta
MNFYVYEDDTTNKARVHTGRCMHCNEGKGRKLTRQPNGRWYGPYGTQAAAQSFAEGLKKKDTNACGLCLPGKKL